MIVAVLVVVAVCASVARAAWSLRRSARPGAGRLAGLAEDLSDVEVAPVGPLRLGSVAAALWVPGAWAGAPALRRPQGGLAFAGPGRPS